MSNDKPFRKQLIQIETGDISIEAKPLTEIFKFNTQPYLIFGVSGSGKTTIALDLIYNFAKECTNIYYMTKTTESMNDDGNISLIPKCFRREPSIENIISIWEEISNFTETINVTEENLFNLIKTAYKDKASNMIIEINEEKDKICKEMMQKYKDQGKDVPTSSKLAQTDGRAFVYETIISIIDDYIKNNTDAIFSNKELSIIRSFYSKSAPKTLLILDDITGQLEAMASSNTKVVYNGKPMREKECISMIINDMLTRSRHYNALICIFLHSTVSCIKDKSMIVNLVFLNEGAIDKVNNARTLPDTAKDIMKVAKSYVFNNGYDHYFLYINANNVNQTCVGKASIHDPTEKLKLDKLNQEYCSAYNQIASGIDNEIMTKINQDNSYDSSSDIEDFI